MSQENYSHLTKAQAKLLFELADMPYSERMEDLVYAIQNENNWNLYNFLSDFINATFMEELEEPRALIEPYKDKLTKEWILKNFTERCNLELPPISYNLSIDSMIELLVDYPAFYDTKLLKELLCTLD